MFTETKELMSQLQSRMNQLEEQHTLKDIQLNEAMKMIQKLESENEDLKIRSKYRLNVEGNNS